MYSNILSFGKIIFFVLNKLNLTDFRNWNVFLTEPLYSLEPSLNTFGPVFNINDTHIYLQHFFLYIKTLMSTFLNIICIITFLKMTTKFFFSFSHVYMYFFSSSFLLNFGPVSCDSVLNTLHNCYFKALIE